MYHSYPAQWSQFDAPRSTVFKAPRRLQVPASLVQAARTTVEVCAGVVAVVGFAGLMWLMVAGPGFLDGRSSTAEHGPQRTVVRQATR